MDVWYTNVIMVLRANFLLFLASTIYLATLVYIWLLLVLNIKEFLKNVKDENIRTIATSSTSLLKICSYLETWGIVGIVVAVLMTYIAVMMPTEINMKLMLLIYPAIILFGSIRAIRYARELKNTP